MDKTVLKLVHGQSKDERRTHILARGFHPDLAAVGFNDFFNDKQAEAAAAGVYLGNASAADKFFEQFPVLAFGDADARIAAALLGLM